MRIYSSVKELPEVIQNALKAVGYHKADISLEAKEKVSVVSGAGDGYRGFAILISMSDNTYEIIYGSWGGSNMFVSRVVDSDTQSHFIPENMCVITGVEGGGKPTICNAYLNPKNFVKYLPEKLSLSLEEKDYLRQLATLKPGYRSKPSTKVVEFLLEKKLIKQNKTGSIQITTEGKSAWR